MPTLNAPSVWLAGYGFDNAQNYADLSQVENFRQPGGALEFKIGTMRVCFVFSCHVARDKTFDLPLVGLICARLYLSVCLP